MFKTLFAVALFFFSFSITKAQEQVRWSEEIKHTGMLFGIFADSGAQFYSVRLQGGSMNQSLYLNYHQDFKVVSKGKIVSRVGKSIATLQDLQFIGHSPVVFLSDKREGKYELYAQVYGKDCQTEGEPKRVFSFPISSGLQKLGTFDVIVSKNRQYFVVEYTQPETKEQAEKHYYRIYDRQFQLLLDGEYESSYPGKQVDFSHRYISNHGDYFLACNVMEVNDRGRVKSNQWLEKVIVLQATEEGMEEFELDLDGRKIYDMQFSSDNERMLTFSGTFGEQFKNNIQGIFYFRLDFKKKEVVDEGFEKFKAEDLKPSEAVDIDETQVEMAILNPGLYDYKIRETYTLPDGSIVGIMEQYYEQSFYNGDIMTRSRSTIYYYYNDIIVFKVNPTGLFEWVKKINKVQLSVNDGGMYSSFAYYLKDNQLNLIFNDHKQNYDERGVYLNGKMGTSFRKRTNCVIKTAIDISTGESRREMLFGPSESMLLALPKKSVINDTQTELLLPVEAGKREKYGLLKL